MLDGFSKSDRTTFLKIVKSAVQNLGGGFGDGGRARRQAPTISRAAARPPPGVEHISKIAAHPRFARERLVAPAPQARSAASQFCAFMYTLHSGMGAPSAAAVQDPGLCNGG